MKRFKSGFSLAEVLLALAIVAIIATLGFTISRKGIEHAYNQYIYTGYNALSIAIADANANGKYYDTNGGDNQDFYKHIYNLLNDKKELSAASDIPVIANNTLRLPFMGVITGAADNETNGIISTDAYWGEDGMPGLEITTGEDLRGGGSGGGCIVNCQVCGNPIDINAYDWHLQRHKEEQYYCPHGDHIATCNICHPQPDPHPDTDNPDNNNDPSFDGNKDVADGFNPGQGLNPGNNTTTSKDYTTITVANGIGYRFAKGEMELYKGLNENGEPEYDKVDFLSIDLSIPSPKNKFEVAGYKLMYIPNSEYPLIPYSGQELDKIADRIDILSYVIDDGETGRVGPDSNYKPLKRYTFREAVCHYNPDGYKIKPNSTDTGNDYVDLFGCPEGIEPVQGALQLVGPRR